MRICTTSPGGRVSGSSPCALRAPSLRLQKYARRGLSHSHVDHESWGYPPLARGSMPLRYKASRPLTWPTSVDTSGLPDARGRQRPRELVRLCADEREPGALSRVHLTTGGDWFGNSRGSSLRPPTLDGDSATGEMGGGRHPNTTGSLASRVCKGRADSQHGKCGRSLVFAEALGRSTVRRPGGLLVGRGRRMERPSFSTGGTPVACPVTGLRSMLRDAGVARSHGRSSGAARGFSFPLWWSSD